MYQLATLDLEVKTLTFRNELKLSNGVQDLKRLES
jgi:hypothetical protein